MAVKCIDEIPRAELTGQKVMVRIEPETAMTLLDSLATVTFLSQAGARVIIAADQRLDEARLTQLLGRRIEFVDDLALDPRERLADDGLGSELAELCDIYCNDAFSISHETRASTVIAARKAKLAVAGLAFGSELNLLEILLGPPEDPTLAMLGGELSEEKLLLTEEIARRADHTLVAGQLLIPFLVARGVLPGDGVLDGLVVIAERIMKQAQEDNRFIATPVDFTVMDQTAFERLIGGEPFVRIPSRNIKEDELTPDQVICDIGSVTQWSWSELFVHLRRIFWHGPLGISEIDLFCEGSRFLASELVRRTSPQSHRTVVCGQSLVVALRRIGFQTERIRHLTSSGRATLHYFARRPLLAVEVLKKTDERYREEHRVLIPLDGSANDNCVLRTAADTVPRNAKLFLLYVHRGLDQERYPDVIAALTDTEKVRREAQAERIFALANGILSTRGLTSADQRIEQGKPSEVISRYAARIGATLIVTTGVAHGHAGATLTARCAVESRHQTQAIVETAAMEKLAINELAIDDLPGKRVFVRIDADVELARPGVLKDIDKLRACVPTLEYLKAAGARIVIGTHLGDPSGKERDGLRLDPVADALSALLRTPVRKLNDVIGENVVRTVTEMKDGEFVMLENLRFHPGEDANDPHFALHLAELCDIYCNDAFALSHRAMASTVGITRHVKPATTGLLLSRELTMLDAVLAKPDKPFLGIIAGARIEEKLPALENLLPQLDVLFIGGALAFTFLKARGYEVGSAPVHEAFLPIVKDLLRNAKVTLTDVVFPLDFIVVNADAFDAFGRADSGAPTLEARQAFDYEIQPWELPVDIGPTTVERMRSLINDAQTVLWNGPLGIAEIERFAEGTRQVARSLLENKTRAAQRTIICGESLSRVLRESDLSIEAIRHVSTGGESALQLLAGWPLPAVAALSDAADARARNRQRVGKLLLPVDDSEHSLNAVSRIGEFVDAEAAEITLLYVQKPLTRVFRDEERQRQREIERRYQAERLFAAANAALARQGLISHRQLTIEGKPATEILRCADEIAADLILMGSRGRSGLVEIVRSGVSQTVSKRARCPVLIVRIPDEEVSKAA